MSPGMLLFLVSCGLLLVVVLVLSSEMKKQKREELSKRQKWMNLPSKAPTRFVSNGYSGLVKSNPYQRPEDVCQRCKTVNPKRCACGTCISRKSPCWENKSSSSDDECAACSRKEREAAYQAAKAKGWDVCDTCLAVSPRRCSSSSCGACLECEDGGWYGECYWCYSIVND